jgi:TRAP-type C4-dicarboxylate transport system substrate-binding protein
MLMPLRRASFSLAVSMLVAGTAGLAAAPAMAQAKWDMPTPYADGNFHTKNIRQMADEIRAASGGKLNIVVQSNGSLIKHPEIKRAVQTGQVNIGEVLISVLSNESPIFAFDSVPFLAASYKDTARLWKAARPVLEKRLNSQGLVLLTGVPWPPQGIYTKRPFNSQADIKGLKFRTYSPATSEFARLLGLQPVTIQVPEIPQAFLTGAVDAMITSPATGVDTQAWDYLQFYYDVQAFLPLNMVIMNRAAFDKLDAASQKAVMDAAKAAETRGWQTSESETVRLTKLLEDKKIRVIQPTDTFRKELQSVGAKMTEDWGKRAGAEGEEILKAYKATK